MSAFEASFAAAVAELARAYDSVPFYRPHLDAAGLRPGDIRGPADFRRVPATSKADYRRHFPAGVLVRGSTPADDFVFRSRSPGTTGDRLVTLALRPARLLGRRVRHPVHHHGKPHPRRAPPVPGGRLSAFRAAQLPRISTF
jgi:phenylacetate-CoA ligase